MSRPVRKGRRHDFGACERGGDYRLCEAEARRAAADEDAARAAEARSKKVAAVADLAADLLALTPVPLEDEQAVKLAIALVEKGYLRKGRR